MESLQATILSLFSKHIQLKDCLCYSSNPKEKLGDVMKKVISVALILSQIFLLQSCFLRTLDKTMVVNTSIESTTNYNSGDHYYQNPNSGFKYTPSVTNESITDAYNFYSQPTGDPLGY